MRSHSKVSSQSRNPNKQQTLESRNEYFTKTTNHAESLKKIQLLNQMKQMLPQMRKSDMMKVTQSVTALPKVNQTPLARH
jgi:protease II